MTFMDKVLEKLARLILDADYEICQAPFRLQSAPPTLHPALYLGGSVVRNQSISRLGSFPRGRVPIQYTVQVCHIDTHTSPA